MRQRTLNTPLALSLSALLFLCGDACATAQTGVASIVGAPYEQGLYDLAFKVFMGNSNPADALVVAERAVQAKPEDKEWRRRAAQVSEWSGKPLKSLENWAYLAQRGDEEAILNALRISRSIQDFNFRKPLIEKLLLAGKSDPALFREYLFVIEGAGLPEEALAFISSGRLKVPRDQLLLEKARLSEVTGYIPGAISAYEQLSIIRGLTTVESLRMASLWYGQGAVDNAWAVINKASLKAAPDADDFWRTYGDLAWARQEEGEADKAIGYLRARGKTLEQDYQRLLLIHGDHSPEKTYSAALEGWRKFRKPQFFHSVVSSGTALGKISELSGIVRSFSKEEHQAIASDGLSWVLISQILRLGGDDRGALTAAWAAVRVEPGNPDIAVAYAWLLVDMKRTGELKRMVPKWEAALNAAPVMREPLAAALMLLGESGKALIHFRRMAVGKQGDPSWLASYGDVLEQAGHPEAAWEARRRAHSIVFRAIESRAGLKKDDRHKLLQTRLQLLMHLSPGDKASRLARNIAVNGKEKFDKELVIAWTMSSSEYDLARLWYWRAFAKEREKPEWALLGLALEENDRVAINDLIEANIERLP